MWIAPLELYSLSCALVEIDSSYQRNFKGWKVLFFLFVKSASCIFSMFYISSPQSFWHQRPVSWKTVFPWTGLGVGGWFQDNPSVLYLLSILFLWLSQLHLRSSSVGSWRLGTPALERSDQKWAWSYLYLTIYLYNLLWIWITMPGKRPSFQLSLVCKLVFFLEITTGEGILGPDLVFSWYCRTHSSIT